MKKPYLITLLVYVVLLPFIFKGVAKAQTVQLNPEPEVHESAATPEPNELEKTVAAVLLHIVQSRVDIHKSDLESARHEVEDAESLMSAIWSKLPTAVASIRIRIARMHLEYETPEQVMWDLPSIYHALEDLKGYSSTDKARQHLGEARKEMGKGNKAAAAKEFELADKSLVSGEDNLLRFEAEEDLNTAKDYLSRKEAAKADKILKDAEEKVQAFSPPYVSHAKKSFWNAYKNYAAREVTEAKKYLEQGRVYLERAERSGEAKGTEEVVKLSLETVELEREIDKGGKEAESGLKSLWERSEALSERYMEYLAAKWEKEETTLGIVDDLIEAKLHAAYAETYQVTAGEPYKVVKEIDEAVSYLKKAMKNRLADVADNRKISGVIKELDDLKANPGKKDATVKNRYESIKAELSRLIRKV